MSNGIKAIVLGLFAELRVENAPGNLLFTIRHEDGSWDPFGNVEEQTGNLVDLVDVACTATGTVVIAADTGVFTDMHACACTGDGRLWHTIRYFDGTWQPLGDVTAQAGDGFEFAAVSCASAATPIAGTNEFSGEVLHVCGITTDGGLWHTIRFANGAWQPFGDVLLNTGDVGRFVDIACCFLDHTPPGGGLHVIGTTTDGGLWHTIRFANGAWQPFGDVLLNTGDVGRFLKLDCSTTNLFDLHVCGITTDGGLWHTIRFANGAWQPFGDVLLNTGNRGNLLDVTCSGSGDLNVCVVNDTGQLWHTIRHSDAYGSWNLFGDVVKEGVKTTLPGPLSVPAATTMLAPSITPPPPPPMQTPVTTPTQAQPGTIGMIADLVASSSWVEPSFPGIGLPFTVFCTFCNNGGLPSGAFTVRFERDGGADSYDVESPSLSPGQCLTAQWYQDGLDEGQHYFYIYIDWNNQVNESNKSNNLGYVGVIIF